MMTASAQAGRRGLTPFRLADVPVKHREAAYSQLMKRSDSLVEQIQLGLACHEPSDRVYWVTTAAWNTVMAPKP